MRFWALSKKELLLLSRDWHALGALFVMPSLFLVIMAFAMSAIYQDEVPALKLNVQVPTSSPASEFFLAALQQQLPNSNLNAAHSSSTSIIMLNENFAAQLHDTPHQGPHLFFPANSDNLSRQRIRSSVTIALAQARLWAFLIDSELLAEDEPLEQQLHLVQERTQSQQEEFQLLSSGAIGQPANASQLSVPAWLIFGMFFIVLPMSNSLQLEFQSGVLVRLRALPLAQSTLLLSKLAPYGLINLLQFGVLFSLGFVALPLMGLPPLKIDGNALAYLSLALCITSACCCFGLLLASLAKNTEHALLLSAGSNLILAAIGGIMVPKEMMPENMQRIAEFSPMNWALDAFLTLLVGQGQLQDIATWCYYLLAFALCTGGVGVILLHRRVQTTLWTSHN